MFAAMVLLAEMSFPMLGAIDAFGWRHLVEEPLGIVLVLTGIAALWTVALFAERSRAGALRRA